MQISRRDPYRGYTYTATFTQGSVSRITAGCRVWSGFTQAFAHYRGAGPYVPAKWADWFIGGSAHCCFGNKARQSRARNNALHTIELLKKAVLRKQREMRAVNTAAKKRARHG
jgi:hypothetical protein